MFHYDRDVPPEWTQSLRTISEPSDTMGFLHILWEPGDVWAPVQRWEVYELLHPSQVSREKILDLMMRSPRWEGHICTSVPIHEWVVRPPRGYQPCLCRHKGDAWKPDPNDVECTSFSRTQWKLFRETGYVGYRRWIIEGSTGGHVLEFSQDEQRLRALENKPMYAPAPGSQAYADFDNRTLAQLLEGNLLRQLRVTLAEYRRLMGADFAEHKASIDKALRARMVRYVDTQMQDVDELFLSAMDKGEMDGRRRTRIDYDRLGAANEEHFVETGRILAPSQLNPTHATSVALSGA